MHQNQDSSSGAGITQRSCMTWRAGSATRATRAESGVRLSCFWHAAALHADMLVTVRGHPPIRSHTNSQNQQCLYPSGCEGADAGVDAVGLGQQRWEHGGCSRPFPGAPTGGAGRVLGRAGVPG
eukprot:366551-Chlamydomonas_euryale.AAC.30